MYVRACLLACGHIPYILNVHLNISRKLNILVHYVKGNVGPLSECSVDNRSGDASSLIPTVPYILFVTACTD